MNSTDLVRLIERDGQQLVEGLYGELKTNLGTSYYRVLGEDEFFDRVYSLYQRLAQWLVSKDNAHIQRIAQERGGMRFYDGIPLGQVILALMLTERHIWDYLSASDRQVDESLRNKVIEFFQITVYSTAKGYEEKLAKSNRLAKRVEAGQGRNVPAVGKASTKPPARKKPKGEPRDEIDVSRGGQVGEFGG